MPLAVITETEARAVLLLVLGMVPLSVIVLCVAIWLLGRLALWFIGEEAEGGRPRKEK